MTLGVVILAAGQGTRMRSDIPKVLHPLAGRPLLAHVLDTAAQLQPDKVIVVYGHGGEQVPETIGRERAIWVEQVEQLGTGHAVQQTLSELDGMERLLVLYGDVPLVGESTLRALLDSASPLTLLTVELADPSGYGRIIRDTDARVECIVEHKDATNEQHQVREINSGILSADCNLMRDWLGQLGNDNAQGEYYLTDVVGMAVEQGQTVSAVQAANEMEVAGVNDRRQLANMERHYQMLQAERLLMAGVTLRDPARFDLRGRLTHGTDVEIDVNAVLEGDVVLGDGVSIGPNCWICNARIGDGVQVFANSVIEQAEVGAGSRIGPFARLRPDARLADHVHVGNFVEIKKSDVASGSKINHLSYVGDSSVGARVNIGAGTITCNYDGANKHRTEIGDDAFIGSDTQLVAPVKVGAGATIGAGSTITRDTPEGQLTLCRATAQRSLPGWKRPTKQPK